MTALTLDEFDFDLPDRLIALRPARPRSASRLLLARRDRIEDRVFADLPKLLRSGDLLVFNDTKVIPARLSGERRRESRHGSGVASIEVTLIGPAAEAGTWRALAKPAKRLKAGDRIHFAAGLSAQVLGRDGAEVSLGFSATGAGFEAALGTAGEMPLPPYIASKRAVDERDRTDYQTVFARQSGAVAAPTASLHFDAAVLAGLQAAGIEQCFVTLHVGAGTFLPVTTAEIENHRMHAETGEVPMAAAAAIVQAKQEGRRVIPVGTTALRVLETAALGGQIAPWSGATDIFIRPGFRFNVADGLMTNFHLPRSTLMMLVSALMGVERIRRIYEHAIEAEYRFFSYGDSSLLLPDT